jgi:hypothetical protein
MTFRSTRSLVHPARAGLLVALSLLAAVLCAGTAHAATGPKVTITKVAVADRTVTVRGRVKVTPNTAKQRKRTRVVLTLTGAKGAIDRFRKAKVSSAGGFKATRVTKLSGNLTLAARVTVAGKKKGGKATRKVFVDAAPAVLRGTFRLTTGQAAAQKAPTGSWFQMVNPTGAPLQNLTSPSANKDYTPLAPGTDGGLRTDVFQAPPVPAFSLGATGDALAKRIIHPVSFLGTQFSVVTAAKDPQVATTDPLPVIRQHRGKLSGQITAWAAQWNGQSFNQGTPKPDGTTPGATSALTGTYDPSTHRFVLQWKSLIVGGPFDKFVGSWHLEGTFSPR